MMTPQELTARAKTYVNQAIARLKEAESKAAVPEAMHGDWVSLVANLESAKSDLDTLTKGD